VFQRASSLDEARVLAAVDRLDAAAGELAERDSTIGSWRVVRSADIRYFGQISGYLTLVLADGDPIAALRAAVEEFAAEHKREFGYELPAAVAEAEIVNLRAALIGEVNNPPEPVFEPAPERVPTTVGQGWFAGHGRVETAYVQREGLPAGERVEGPAVIVEWNSTTVVPPGSVAEVQPSGDLVIEIG
jgi:N-methylhydantoinase A